MASIVYQEKKGIKYAYSSESYWDKDKKAPRTRRKYLGKVDPKTGEIIGKKKPEDKFVQSTNPEVIKLQGEIKRQSKQIETLQKDLDTAREKYRKASDTLKQIQALIRSTEN